MTQSQFDAACSRVLSEFVQRKIGVRQRQRGKADQAIRILEMGSARRIVIRTGECARKVAILEVHHRLCE